MYLMRELKHRSMAVLTLPAVSIQWETGGTSRRQEDKMRMSFNQLIETLQGEVGFQHEGTLRKEEATSKEI